MRHAFARVEATHNIFIKQAYVWLECLYPYSLADVTNYGMKAQKIVSIQTTRRHQSFQRKRLTIFAFFNHCSIMSRNSLIELLLLMSMFLCTTAIPLEDFYPYGPDVGDSQVNPAINHNGHISFGDVDVWVSWLLKGVHRTWEFLPCGLVDIIIIIIFTWSLISNLVCYIQSESWPIIVEVCLVPFSYVVDLSP